MFLKKELFIFLRILNLLMNISDHVAYIKIFII